MNLLTLLYLNVLIMLVLMLILLVGLYLNIFLVLLKVILIRLLNTEKKMEKFYLEMNL